jgi:glycosyltransferase involved in cell wall biosynthesis
MDEGHPIKRTRIAIVSEFINEQTSEGIRKSARELADTYEDLDFEVARFGAKASPKGGGPSFFHRATGILDQRKRLSEFGPDILIYIPSSNRIFLNLLKLRLWKKCAEKSAMILLLPPRGRWSFSKMISRDVHLFIQFDASLIPEEISREKIRYIPSGVDVDKFLPVRADEKARLKTELGIKPDDKVVLSVGHLTTGRRLDVLVDASKKVKAKFVFVSSDMPTDDPRIQGSLESAGIILIKRYLPRIQDVYGAADCYLFTTGSTDSAIGMPLSILEAMSMNIPVVTRDFSSLSKNLGEPPEESGIYFIDDEKNVVEKIERALSLKEVRTRSIALDFTWKRAAERILREIEKRTRNQ